MIIELSVKMENVTTLTPKELVNELKKMVVKNERIYPNKVDEEVAFDEDVTVTISSHSGPCSKGLCGREPK